jgi:predicted CXXCH cytochrome family protein
MLNKKLVLGSLAGATMLVSAALILPNAAQALVSGTCVNCHTMHNSEDGVAVNGSGAQELLLRASGCAGCHGTEANGSNGKGATTLAPQVGSAASATMNSGGYFNVDSDSHSIGGSIGSLVATNTAPGGSMAAGASFTCQSCHTDAGGTGGHHNAGAGYRMLGAVSVTSTAANYGNGGDTSGYGDSMNTFCGGCHTQFHGTADADDTTSGAGGTAWIRHPTGVGALGPNTDAVPAGTGGEVLCISCHRPHGSGNADLLRWTYSGNIAGDSSQSTGCETCHGSK